MIRTPIHQAQSGQLLARSIPNPIDPSTTAVKRGTVLSARVIRALERMAVRSVWTVEEGVDALDDFAPSPINAPLRALVTTYAGAWHLLCENPEAPLPVEQFRIGLEEAVAELRFLPSFHCVLDHQRHPDFECGWHAARTAVLAVMMARAWHEAGRSRSGDDAAAVIPDETELALGAFLHDIGTALVPESVRMRPGFEATRQDAEECRKHTALGAAFLNEQVGRFAADLAMTHHRNFDGTGYPARHILSGSLLTRGAAMTLSERILSLANAFEVLHGRCGYLTIEALEELNAARSHHFDPDLLHILNRIVPAFDIGSPVNLSSGHLGIVRGFSPETPFQPAVQLVRDPTGASLPEKRRITLRLTDYANLRVRSIDGRRVEHLQPEKSGHGWEDM